MRASRFDLTKGRR